jgi:hypothetical protein
MTDEATAGQEISEDPEVFNFNFGEVSSGFPLVDDGKYRVQLVNVKYVESSKKKTPGVNWEVKIDDPEAGDADGQRLWDDTWLSSAALWKVKAHVEAFLGEPFEENIQANSRAELAAWVAEALRPLIGEYATAVVTQETYTKNDGTPGVKNTISEFLEDEGGNNPFAGGGVGSPSTPII